MSAADFNTSELESISRALSEALEGEHVYLDELDAEGDLLEGPFSGFTPGASGAAERLIDELDIAGFELRRKGGR